MIKRNTAARKKITLTKDDKERLLAAMGFSLSTLGWAGYMDEYETICRLIREVEEPADGGES